MAVYNLSVPSCHINEVRSPIKDTLVASMGLRVMNAQGGLHMDYPPQSKQLGDHRHHNTVAIDLSYSDVDVPDPTPESPDGGAIYWTFVLTNTASSGAVTDLEKIVLGLYKALADKQIQPITTDDPDPVSKLIVEIGLIGLGAVYDLLIPGRCDGIVGALALNLTARQLADMTPDPQKMPCPGTDSPRGCGGNSNYDLFYSVASDIITVFDLTGSWAVGGAAGPNISRSGNALTVDMSAFGRPPAHGSVIDAQTITVTFSDDATFTGGLVPPATIAWSNQTSWTKVSDIITVFDLNGSWAAGGVAEPNISRSGNALTVDMSAFGRPPAHGSVIDAQTITVTFSDDATFTGQLVPPGTIAWSNQTSWTKL
jgi:hypothetical protein